MSAVRFHGQHDVRFEEIDRPTVGNDEVLVKVAWCGICGTDIHEYAHGPVATPSKKPHPLTGEVIPVVLGHEFSGRVVGVGPCVRDVNIGDAVVIEPLLRDGTCASCKTGRYHLCRQLGFIGLSGRGGGLSEYASVSRQNVHVLPPSMDLEIAALIEPLAVALHGIRALSEIQDANVVIFGAGPIGLGVMACLKTEGRASRVVVVEPNESRAAIAESLGADASVQRLPDRMGHLSHLPPDVHIVFNTTNAQRALDDAVRVLQPGGSIVNFGLWPSRPAFDANRLVARELRMIGSFAYSGEFPEIIELLDSGRLDARPMLGKHVELIDTPRVLERLADGVGDSVKVLVRCT